MSKSQNFRKEFEAFLDALAESIETASDDDLLQEAREAGIDPVKEGEMLRQTLLKTASDFKKKALIRARSGYEERVKSLKTQKFLLPQSPQEQRILLAKILALKPQMQAVLTAQHRELKELTDADVESCLKKFAALGVLKDIKLPEKQ